MIGSVFRLFALLSLFGAAEAAALPTPAQSPARSPEAVARWCAEVRGAALSLRWGELEPCAGIDWKIGGTSTGGRPLVYAEFGDPKSPNTTLILAMVHGDEVTPLYVGIQLARWLKENPKSLKGARVVIAPLVNPDGFFSRPRTRMNARGVDINRNFPTRDWPARAVRAWKTKYRSDPRRFPGDKPGSEPETAFQQSLIRELDPQKILSVHSPLNFLDYDGPSPLSLARFPRQYLRECLKLRARLKAITSGFFPGSLGNFAGQERGIPTLTLELPTADPQKAASYWARFQAGIRTMIEFRMPEYASNATRLR